MTVLQPFSLEYVEAFLRDRVAPQAEAMDQDSAILQQAFADLGKHGWLGLRIDPQWGGLAVGDRTFRHFQERVARYSGALAFLQAQHQSAGAFLNRSDNPTLQQTYLPGMATGAVAMGIGFSHLRRSGEPMVKARAIAGGYQLTGTIPWITGFGVFQHVIGAAVLPDGQAVYGVLPLQTTQQSMGGWLRVSDPLPLAVLMATQTVTAELQEWVLPTEAVVFVRPAGAIHASDQLNVLQHSVYALGVAQAGLDIVARTLTQRPFVESAYQALDQELQHCRQAIDAADGTPFEHRLQLRAWAIALAGRCAQAGVVVSAGAANSVQHPAQRVFREAMVFSVTGQTPAVMAATLAQLTRSRTQPPSNLESMSAQLMPPTASVPQII